MFPKQYVVWTAERGKPRKIRCDAAIGMKRVKINGTWFDRKDGGLFDTEKECQQWIDNNQNKINIKQKIDPLFLPEIKQ